MSRCEHTTLSPNGEYAVQCSREAKGGDMCWQHRKHDKAARQRALLDGMRALARMDAAQRSANQDDDEEAIGFWESWKLARAALAAYLAAGGTLDEETQT